MASRSCSSSPCSTAPRPCSSGRANPGTTGNANMGPPRRCQMSVAASSFTGFSPSAIQFLADLAANNDRSWFQPRKAEYERLIKEPLEALCVDLGQRFESRGIPLLADPKRSPFRIYRDTRFSKDKSPYKTHVAANFPWIGRGEDP